MTPREDTFRILVVEDHPDVARMMMVMLEMLGHRASVARSIEETIGRLTGEIFDLMIVDYRLPDGTGAELLKKVSSKKDLRAVLVTAHDQGLLEPSARAGFSACLTKPVDMDELRRVIETVCAR